MRDLQRVGIRFSLGVLFGSLSHGRGEVAAGPGVYSARKKGPTGWVKMSAGRVKTPIVKHCYRCKKGRLLAISISFRATCEEILR